MVTYQVGETPKLEAEIRSEDTGLLADPTTVTINIADHPGTLKVTNGTMTRESQGKYYYDEYTIPSDGNLGTWNWNTIATGSAGRVAIMKSSFEVEASI